MAEKHCTCKYCGAEFVSNRKTAICSTRCADKHRPKRDRSIAWQPKQLTCQCCGKLFIQAFHGQKMYCSKKCNRKKWFALNPEKVREYSQKDKARRIAQEENKPKFTRITHCTCVVCNKAWWNVGGAKSLCSRECKLEYGKQQSRVINEFKKDMTPRLCKQCGVLFVAEYGNKHRVFCSNDCAKKHRNKKKSRGGNAQRAKRAGVERRYFNKMRIFERDNWKCQLCGVKTPKRLRGTYNDAAPEIDHILPIKQGGGHVQENVQCACRRCNLLKGSRPSGQMWLLGMADILNVKRVSNRNLLIR